MNQGIAARGINGDHSDRSSRGSSAVYVFERSDAGWQQEAYVFARNNGEWLQQAYLKASNTDVRDLFGVSISISADGSTLAVGALEEESAATGVNGDQADVSAPSACAVYLY